MLHYFFLNNITWIMIYFKDKNILLIDFTLLDIID